MKVTNFVGIDISKAHFHFYILSSGQKLLEGQNQNDDAGILEFLNMIRNLIPVGLDEVVFCMEATGIYSILLIEALHSAGGLVRVEDANRIIKSMGLTRGKSDKLDARRIAEYAVRFEDKLKCWNPKRRCIQDLQLLATYRERLIKVKNQLSVPMQEAAAIMDENQLKLFVPSSQALINLLTETLNKVEKMIKQIIAADPSLHKMVKQLKSIPGIGPVIAAEMVVRTNEFKDFKDAKKLACHVGVAPYEHSSGSSIRGRTRVSHHAHKRLKTLLNLGAVSVIRRKNEFSEYYQRKIQSGKSALSVLNVIRNKIIHRAFAVIKNNTMYEKNYQHMLA